jgi:hypothetical protein
MKAKIFAVSIVMCLLAATLPMWAAETAIDAKSIIGSWKISSVDTGEGAFPVSGKLSVVKKADGSLDVQYSGGFGGGTVSGAKLDGKKLTFVVTSQGFNGDEMKSNYEFTIQDSGKLSGKTSGGRGGERELVANRIWPKPDCVGQWEMKAEMAGNVMNSKLVLSVNDAGKLVGKWTMQMGENEMTSELSDIKFEKGKLSFTRTMKMGENQVVSKFEGEVKGNDITGKSVSDRGEMIVTGTRVGKEIIGTWDLNINSDMGDMTGKLIIDKDLSAVYTIYFSGFGGETALTAASRAFDMDISNLKLTGQNLTFNAGLGQFSQEFKGKIAGDKLDGEMSSDMGTSKITGKKALMMPVKPTATPAK